MAINIKMLKITISILVGTCLGLYFNIALLFLFLIIAIYFLILRKEYKIYLLFSIIIFIIVQLGEYKYLKIQDYIDKRKDKNINIIASVISNKEEKEYTNKYVMKIQKWDYELNEIKFILYTSKDINLNYGDIIKINGSIENAEVARNTDGFNYMRYLRQEKICGICRAENIEKIAKNKNVFYYIFKFKEYCIQILDDNFDKREANFLKGILLGDTRELDSNTKSNFQKSNLAHVLAISGMHIVYIIFAIDFILDKIIISKKLKNYFEIIFLIFFCVFTGSSASCIRSVIMMILVLISKNIYRLNDFYSNLFFSFCFILIYNPYSIEAVGMWLSFLGTLALVLFRKKIENPNKIINYILNNLYTSITVQILIFPIILYCYNSVSFTFFISNILVSVFVGPVLILGYICLILYKFKLLVIIENILIKIIMKIAAFISSFSISNILVGTPKFILVIIYYIVIICFINRKKIKEYLEPKILCIKNNVIIKYFRYDSKINIYSLIKILIFISITSIILFNFYLNSKENIEIYFLDVGQGDCTFIILPDGKNLLIDGGNREEDFNYGERVVAPYLLDKNITKIDYMIVSHFDSDHVGGLLYIAQNFNVKNILIGLQFESNDNLNEMINIIKDRNINLIIADAGDKITINKDCYMDILFPIREEKIEENVINNNSLVFKLCLKDNSILFTGDIEEEAEEKIVRLYKEKLKCNILKVAHHGSSTSSIEEFIKYAKPEIALIGVRKK